MKKTAKKKSKPAPKAKAKPAPKKPAAKAVVKAAPIAADREKSLALFSRALQFAATTYYLDAIACFRKAAEADPKGDLADDAWMNAGLCYFELKLFHEAAEYFSRVIQGYPKATIHAVPGAQESGKTAAKAHLGRLRAYIALGRRDDAQRELDELNKYPESNVTDGGGKKITFYELGLQALK
jgi:tetratricopeptide (TPR) repeat protein